MKLYHEGTVRPNDFDRDCLMDMQRLALPLMEKVVEHCEGERGFLANSRSKSGFLRSMCMRAKRGELDPRGYGAVDPWKNHILAMVNYDKKENINKMKLEEENKWIEDVDEGEPIQVVISCGKCEKMGKESLDVKLPLTAKIDEVVEKVLSEGCDWPKRKIRVRHSKLGFLRNERSLAYYNAQPAASFELEICMNLRGNHKKKRKDFQHKLREVAKAAESKAALEN